MKSTIRYDGLKHYFSLDIGSNNWFFLRWYQVEINKIVPRRITKAEIMQYAIRLYIAELCASRTELTKYGERYSIPDKRLPKVKRPPFIGKGRRATSIEIPDEMFCILRDISQRSEMSVRDIIFSALDKFLKECFDLI